MSQPSAKTRFESVPGIVTQVADFIQEKIVRGEFAPGERIPEARLTAELGVSRGPVREALQVLLGKHLVRMRPRAGARVSPFGPIEVEGLYDLQEVLLSLLASQAVASWRGDDLARFAALRDRIDAAAGHDDPMALLALSLEFQRAACEIVGNEFLQSALENLMPSFSRAHYRVLAAGRTEMRALAGFIEGVMAAVIDRDGAAAKLCITAYLRHHRRVVLTTYP